MGAGKEETRASTKEEKKGFLSGLRKKRSESPEDHAKTLVDHLNVCIERVEALLASKESDIKSEPSRIGYNREARRIFIEMDRHLQCITDLCEDYQELEG